MLRLGQIECPLYGRRTPILHVQGAELPNMDAERPNMDTELPNMDTERPNMDAVMAEGAEARQGRGASYYVLPTSDGSLVCFALAPGTAPAACAALY